MGHDIAVAVRIWMLGLPAFCIAIGAVRGLLQ
jgi:hypothetical protein